MEEMRDKGHLYVDKIVNSPRKQNNLKYIWTKQQNTNIHETKFTELRKGIDSLPMIVGDLNTLSIVDKISRQKVS